jgi:hypothetical protein
MRLVLGLVRWTAQTLARSASEISAASRQMSRSTLLLDRDSWIFRGNSAFVLRKRKIDKNDSGFRVIFELLLLTSYSQRAKRAYIPVLRMESY